MKNLKKLLATGMMMGALMVGTGFASPGILMSDYTGTTRSDDPCKVDNDDQTNNVTGILMSDYAGILMSDFAGILMSDYTGIIVAGVTDEEPVCGIIVAGKN